MKILPPADQHRFPVVPLLLRFSVGSVVGFPFVPLKVSHFGAINLHPFTFFEESPFLGFPCLRNPKGGSFPTRRFRPQERLLLLFFSPVGETCLMRNKGERCLPLSLCWKQTHHESMDADEFGSDSQKHVLGLIATLAKVPAMTTTDCTPAKLPSMDVKVLPAEWCLDCTHSPEMVRVASFAFHLFLICASG